MKLQEKNKANQRPAQPARPAQAASTATSTKSSEQKVFGLRACLAIFEHRPDDIIKVYLSAARERELGKLLTFCRKTRRAFKVIPDEESALVSGSKHHEGLSMIARTRQLLGIAELLTLLKAKNRPPTLLFLENVGNPHNLGAIARTAAHFSVDALILGGQDPALPSGAAMRTAEGGFECLRLARSTDDTQTMQLCKKAGFGVIASSPRAKETLFELSIPKSALILVGAEGEGLSEKLYQMADIQVRIPGSGAVESLNVSTATAVLLAERLRQLE